MRSSERAIEIRPARPEDLPAVLDLLEVVAAEDAFIATEAPVDRPAVEAAFRSRYLSGAPGAAMFVAVAGSEVVGRISLSGDRTVSLGMLVAPGWRGHGIGTRLLEEGIRWARERGARAIALDVFPGNVAALALYEKHGFRRTGVAAGRYVRRSGEVRDAVLMELRLTRG